MKARFFLRYGYTPPAPWADLTGYEPLLDVFLSERLHRFRGDVLEIGALMGGGTAKLCGLLAKFSPDRRVIAVDLFDPSFDTTWIPIGTDMATLYAAKIGEHGRDQRTVFDTVTSDCKNLIVVAGDSMKVEVPTDELVLSFIDGHHAPEYVRHDFHTAWSRTVPGGVVAFHDYGSDLPHVTETIHSLIGEHSKEIERVWVDGIILFAKRATPV